MMPESLCERCAHTREITTGKGSRFLLCGLSLRDRGYEKYPRQPVRRCEGFTERDKPAGKT